MKTALAIHDLSCYAKSSLTVVLPVLESAAVECAVLPTAILSSQSDGFGNLYSVSQSESCHEIMERWSAEGLVFDSVYSGYLDSPRQCDLVLEAVRRFSKPGTLILTDPVLGDGLELYQTMDEEQIGAMRSLIAHASIITPNWTEAQLLVDGKAEKESCSAHEAEEYARKLSLLSGAKVVITSVPSFPGQLVNLAYDGKEVRIFSNEMLSPSYPGCGDLFASLLLSLLLSGWAFFPAVRKAGEIATYALSVSLREGRERRMGVAVAPAIRALGECVLF